jgi:hypothetical protein
MSWSPPGLRARGERNSPEYELGNRLTAANTNDVLARFRSYDCLLAFIGCQWGTPLRVRLLRVFSPDAVLAWAGAVVLVSNAIPALLPAVRAAVRQADGTITGPHARRAGARAAAALPGQAGQ